MCHMTTSLHVAGFIPHFDLGDRVRKARECAGMKQQDLAAVTGIARTTIARIEQGKTDPRRPTILSLAFATGVDLEWLETGKTPVGPEPDGGSQNEELCAIRDSNPEPTDLHFLAA